MTRIQTVEVGLGLGSNEGDRIGNLIAAKKMLEATPGIELIAQSSLYETEPVGVKPEYQHMKFINAVLIIRAELLLVDLHGICLKIEETIGRRRTPDRFSPRPLDIDVLYAGSQILQSHKLRLPHPQCLKRRFVLEPLAEVRADFILPTTVESVKKLLAGLPPGEQVVKLSDPW